LFINSSTQQVANNVGRRREGGGRNLGSGETQMERLIGGSRRNRFGVGRIEKCGSRPTNLRW
jgi:hypothetical protein